MSSENGNGSVNVDTDNVNTDSVPTEIVATENLNTDKDNGNTENVNQEIVGKDNEDNVNKDNGNTDNGNGNTDNTTYTTIGTSGDGVYGATAGIPSEFTVKASECEERVKCGLVVAFDGPEKPDIQFEHFTNGNIGVTYKATVPGVYILTVKYNDKHVRGSPFKINICGIGYPLIKPLVIKRNIVKKVKLLGPNVQEARVNEIAEIHLDISRAEINCEVMIDIDGPMEPKYSVVEKKKGMIILAYTPTVKGDYRFMLRFRGEHVPGSPFTVAVK